jgi:hypothetical protein
MSAAGSDRQAATRGEADRHPATFVIRDSRMVLTNA